MKIIINLDCFINLILKYQPIIYIIEKKYKFKSIEKWTHNFLILYFSEFKFLLFILKLFLVFLSNFYFKLKFITFICINLYLINVIFVN